MIKIKLNNKSFNLIKGGNKTIEVRLNDKKRSLIRIGDNIEFTNTKTKEKINVVVIDLLKYKTFKDLFNNHDIYDFGETNKKSLLDNTRKYYSEDQEEKFGVIGIKIKYTPYNFNSR